MLALKRRLRSYKPYIIASEIKQAVAKHLTDRDSLYRKVVSLDPKGSVRGHALLSIWNEPFVLKPAQAGSKAHHSHYWESLEMADAFLDLGYQVDIIHYKNRSFVPRKEYSFVVDQRWNLERLAPDLPKSCVKIMHLDTAHLLFHNAAEARRLLDLQQRRGVTLRPRRFEMPNLGLEHADCAAVLGNEFTINTYRYANKPIFRVPVSNPVVYSWPEDKDFEACRKRFLWFGSGGLVHKGLDLVLEAFAALPDYHLTVCGPIAEEKDFEKAYRKELYDTPNIHTVGWTDISSEKFIEITRNCLGIVYPSCSEGGGGGVINCMHAGIIPLVSYESSVDVEDFGFTLKNCSVPEIEDTIRKLSDLPSEDLRRMSRAAWEHARANHTRERFGTEYRKILKRIVSERWISEVQSAAVASSSTPAAQRSASNRKMRDIEIAPPKL